MKISTLMSTSVLTLSLLLTGCGSQEVVKTEEENKGKDTLTVFTTIYPLEDFTRKIAGDYVEVKSIYPPNVDAHSFEPSTKDMMKLANSDLFIYTGVGIEGFAAKASEALEKEDVQVLKAAQGIDLIESTDEHHHEGEEGHSESESHEDENTESEVHEDENGAHSDLDPHVWLDPILSIDLANNIKNSLSKLLPEHASEFEANFNLLKSELEKLDQEFKTTIGSARTKDLLVAHAAYGYWEARYGIEEIAISGLSPTQEPSQKELQAIIEESTEHNIHYVIFEQNVSPKVAKIIQEELGQSR